MKRRNDEFLMNKIPFDPALLTKADNMIKVCEVFQMQERETSTKVNCIIGSFDCKTFTYIITSVLFIHSTLLSIYRCHVLDIHDLSTFYTFLIMIKLEVQCFLFFLNWFMELIFRVKAEICLPKCCNASGLSWGIFWRRCL